MIKMRIFGTSVKVKVVVLANVLVLWGGVTWLGLYWHPERNFWQALLIGFITMILLLISDFGHAVAHIFSARYAGAPMDELRISEGMPRTLYWNNEVSPNLHRLRAIGGPIFNLLGLFLSAGIYAIVPGNSLVKELSAWSAVGHGLLLIMSLSPLPVVDGGTLLKWSLVARGKSTAEADRIIQRLDWIIGIVLAVIGLSLLVLKTWIVGLIFLGIGIIVISIATGKIR
jgi:hypothetical protein